LTPKGIVFQILPEGTEPQWDDMKEHVDKLYRFMEGEFNDPYFWKDEEGRKVYSLNLTGLAMYFLEHKRVRHAELMQRLAFQVDPESSSVLNNYGVLYEYTGKLKEAEEMYRKGVEVEPGDPSIRSNLGVVLYKQEKDKAALKEFDRVLKAAPYDQTANYHLGLMAIEHGNEGEFTRRLAMAIRDDPNSKLGRKARELLRKHRRGELELPSGAQ